MRATPAGEVGLSEGAAAVGATPAGMVGRLRARAPGVVGSLRPPALPAVLVLSAVLARHLAVVVAALAAEAAEGLLLVHPVPAPLVRAHQRGAVLGWRYLSNTTCLMRPRLFHARFVVSRTIMIRYSVCHFLKKPCVRQVVLDK